MEKLTMTQEMIKRQLEKVEDSSQIIHPHLKRALNEPNLMIEDYFIFSEGVFYTRSYFHKYHANGNLPYKKEVYKITFNSKTIWELKC